MKTLTILGSTGSIGTQTLEVVKQHPKEFKVFALTAHNNIDLLKKQIEEFKPSIVVVTNKENADQLEREISVPVLKGEGALQKICSFSEGDFVVNALVGNIGILPTITAIKNWKTIGLANKETLVSAGSIVMREAKKHDVRILPIDSEHSAIFQCMQGNYIKDIKKIILTGSGGPLLNYNGDFNKVTVEQALNHPMWNMGRKISIDSATMMNKGFEVIEAMHLFDIPLKKIEVVIHPESIVHSMVEFIDNSIIAQLGFPDMRLPIQYALFCPERVENSFSSLELDKIKTLNFQKPNLQRFPCLSLAYKAAETGGTMPAVMNAVNDFFVERFLNRDIRFLEIYEGIKSVMDKHRPVQDSSVESVMDAIAWAEKELV